VKSGFVIAFAAMLFGVPAAAQDAAPVPCELHVWPADAAQTFNTLLDTNWATFGSADKYSRDASNPLGGTQASVELQKRVYAGADLPGLFGLSGYQVVLHDTPLPSRVIRATKGRLLPDRGPCYAELVTDDVFFQQQHLYDVKYITRSQIVSTFRFRRFDGGETPAFSYGSFITRDLFDPRKKQDLTLSLAIAQFETAFGQSVTDFAAATTAAAQGKPKGRRGK
jgi:hypothetical protein